MNHICLDTEVSLKKVRSDHGRNLCAFVCTFHIPNDALGDLAVLEATKLRLVAPEFTEFLGLIAILLLSAGTMIDQAEGVLCVEDDPDAENGRADRQCLGERAYIRG